MAGSAHTASGVIVLKDFNIIPSLLVCIEVCPCLAHADAMAIAVGSEDKFIAAGIIIDFKRG